MRSVSFKMPLIPSVRDGTKTQTRRLRALGSVGDVLYVREPWRAPKQWNDWSPADLPTIHEDGKGRLPGVSIHYDADGPAPALFGRYRHARFMPEWAARTRVKLVAVREEPLHDIADTDIAAEGVTPEVVDALWAVATKERRMGAWSMPPEPGFYSMTPALLWRIGWMLIHGRASWDENPRVVVHTFQVVR